MELGTLDKNLYSCITNDIDTDRVIITDKQLDHIADNHPEAYDQILVELKETLKDPDYIFKDSVHDNTGLVVRKVESDEESLFIVLRICTDSEGGRLANSVISGWKISSKRLNNYIRNKQVLYKKCQE